MKSSPKGTTMDDPIYRIADIAVMTRAEAETALAAVMTAMADKRCTRCKLNKFGPMKAALERRIRDLAFREARNRAVDQL